MADDSITLTPSDIVGIVQQGLKEISVYLNNAPPHQVDSGTCADHLDRLKHFILKIQPMHVGNGAASGKEARAN